MPRAAFGFGLGSRHRRTTAAVSLPAIAAPTNLRNLSALGTSPLILGFDWTAPGTDSVSGYRGQLQIDGNSDFSSPEQNIVFLMDASSVEGLSENIGLVTPSGTYNSQLRILRDNEAGATTVTDQLGNTFNCDASAYSGPFSDTIAVSVAVWSSTTGTDKSQYLTPSGGNLTLTMNNGVNAECGCRATISVTGKRYFETTVVSHGTETNGSIIIGITDATTALGAAVFPKPGGSGGGGGVSWSYKNGINSGSVNRNGGSTTATNLTAVLTDGDRFGISFDTTANTVKLSHRPVGTGVWGDIQTITLTSQIPAAWRAYAGGYGRTGAGAPYDAHTTNFGAGTFSRTLDAGYLMYG